MDALNHLLAVLSEPLQFGFISRGLLAAVLIGCVCAVIGAFVVMQDLAFIGDALAHAAFPGAVVAYVLKFSLPLGGAFFGIATALGIGFITRRSRISLDTAVGILFAGTFALGVLILSRIKGYTKDLFGLLLGDVLSISESDLVVIALMGLLVVGLIFLLYKEMTLLTFDSVTAQVMGLPSGALYYLLLSLIAITVVISIQTVGIVLVVAMLVTPAATAYLVVRRFSHMMLWGAVQGAVAATAGFYISYYAQVASGASIVLVSTLIFFVVLLLRSRSANLNRLFKA